MRCALCILLFAMLGNSNRADEPKAPVPAAAAQKSANALAAQVYKRDFETAKTPAQKMDVAKKILADGIDADDDAISRFVLFRIARDLSAQQGDFKTAFDAIDRIDREFDVDKLQMQFETAAAAVKALKLPQEKQACAGVLAPLIDDALDADRYDLAKSIAAVTLTCERDGRDANRIKQMIAKAKEVDAVAAGFDEMRAATAILEKTPEDPTANLAVGKFLCLAKGEWQQGVPLLARGSDEAFKNIAALELAESPEKLSIGDGWWKISEGLEGTARLRAQKHAEVWYQQALPSLSGLTKVRVERQLASIRTADPNGNGSTTPASSATSRTSPANRPAQVPASAVHWQGRWYSFPDGKVSFNEAIAAAVKAKARLLTISSEEENAFVRGHLRGPTFLGLKRANGRWLTSDGLVQKYFNWAAGQPQSSRGEDWIAVHPNGQWHDYLQSNLFYALEWGKE